MSIEFTTLLFFSSLFSLIFIGVPVAFALGGVSVVFITLFLGTNALFMIPVIVFKQMNPILLSIPLFLLMANMLESSGIAEDLYEGMYRSLGSLKGGLAIGTVLIGTIFAAISGITGTATVTMGLIALPSMLKRGYNKHIAAGCIMAGGALGIVIPPSVDMIIYSSATGESIGKLFFGGLGPGILIAAMHMLYIGIKSALKPNLCPAVPKEEQVSFKEKLQYLKPIAGPIGLIFIVLGVIYAGVATPTEAAAVGAVGVFVLSALNKKRRLNSEMVKSAIYRTIKLTCMVMWIVAAASCFNSCFIALGARDLIVKLIVGANMNRWIVLIVMQLTIFILGMVMDDYAIILLAAPIYAPIIKSLGFDTLWFGILFILNIEAAFLTPPYGFNLFYMKGIVPKDITTIDLYKSVVPFVIIQMIGLILVMIFPSIATWIPSML